MQTDTQILELVQDYYYADGLEDAHNILADIVFDGDIEEATAYSKCFDENDHYVMPEAMKEFALSLLDADPDEADELDPYMHDND
jgi:hypothetical protein